MTINTIVTVVKTVARLRLTEPRNGNTLRSKFAVAKRVRARRLAIAAKTAAATQTPTSHSKLS
jgi:hypothetical protein